MREEILQILEANNFGQLEGIGRKLRLQDLTAKGVRIEGGLLGAIYSKEKGLVVWNLGARNRRGDVRVSDLAKIEKELDALFKEELEDVLFEQN